MKFNYLGLAVPALVCVQAHAGGLDEFLANLNVQAQADSGGFAARICSQFHVGDAQVRLVLSNVDRPADAFMVYQMSQMTGRPPEEVLRTYRRYPGGHRGWGEMAKEMGIKPGSREFHNLKDGRFRLRERGPEAGGAGPGRAPGPMEPGGMDAGPGHGHGNGHGHGPMGKGPGHGQPPVPPPQ